MARIGTVDSFPAIRVLIDVSGVVPKTRIMVFWTSGLTGACHIPYRDHYEVQ